MGRIMKLLCDANIKSLQVCIHFDGWHQIQGRDSWENGLWLPGLGGSGWAVNILSTQLSNVCSPQLVKPHVRPGVSDVPLVTTEECADTETDEQYLLVTSVFWVIYKLHWTRIHCPCLWSNIHEAKSNWTVNKTGCKNTEWARLRVT